MSAPGPARRAKTSRTDWSTPWPLFRKLDQEFRFTLDAAASYENRKCERYLTEEEDALTADVFDQTVWCNPPYGRGLEKWVMAFVQWQQLGGCTVVALLPDCIDTEWFATVWMFSHEIRLLRGRVNFEGSLGGNTAGSIIAIFRPQPVKVSYSADAPRGGRGVVDLSGFVPPRVSLWDWRR